MKPDQKTLDESYRKWRELEAVRFKPKPGFRSIGDDLSGHEGAMITFGMKAAAKKDPKAETAKD
jgi:hypothetical protein